MLLHNGNLHTLKLPGKTYANFQLLDPPIGSKELSWRLPCTDGNTVAARQDLLTFETPWSAKFMSTSTELSCRDCGEIILVRDRLKSWKDLPSEDWAEMMDFWHCHKPEDHNENNDPCHSSSMSTSDKLASSKDTLVGRAYGANSRFSAQPGTVLIDITTFLMVKEDCSRIRIEKLDPTPHGHSSVICLGCQNELGFYDFDFLGIRFFKWKLNCSKLPSFYSTLTSSSPTEALSSSFNPKNNLDSRFPASMFVTSKILSKMASHLVSKFLLTPISLPGRSTNLLLWIFGTSLRFTSTRYNPTCTNDSPSCGQAAVKVFWKVVSKDNTCALRDNIGVEEIILPRYVITEIEEVLKRSSCLLPASSQKYQDWSVGLLERYEE